MDWRPSRNTETRTDLRPNLLASAQLATKRSTRWPRNVKNRASVTL